MPALYDGVVRGDAWFDKMFLITSHAQHLICRHASILRILPFLEVDTGWHIVVVFSTRDGREGRGHVLEQPNLLSVEVKRKSKLFVNSSVEVEKSFPEISRIVGFGIDEVR